MSRPSDREFWNAVNFLGTICWVMSNEVDRRHGVDQEQREVEELERLYRRTARKANHRNTRRAEQ